MDEDWEKDVATTNLALNEKNARLREGKKELQREIEELETLVKSIGGIYGYDQMVEKLEEILQDRRGM